MKETNEGSAESSMEQLAEFYDTADTTELEGEDVEIEPTSRAMVSRSVRLSRETMNAIRKIADERNVGVTQLMREWILERLTEEQANKSVASHATPSRSPSDYSEALLHILSTIDTNALSRVGPGAKLPTGVPAVPSPAEVLKGHFVTLAKINEPESAAIFLSAINRAQKREKQQLLVQAKRQVARTLGKHGARVRIS
ncbi:CopG family antitoxin [Microbispora sp. NBRC 16548]|uniref:CopG family antitoxin n=1 Tax=Microbispora sp. NBRC 16548 TaxID=3030994 RepID=UPI0024A324EC|nr:CopG family antitoxin [Microbispora sp. NBRC 16548]GLX10677.1 hypothetical protein Misp03_76030 [Microbispora sp. NBRC 16548]